jgi:tetratricopeptide (TPR) repeat protein
MALASLVDDELGGRVGGRRIVVVDRSRRSESVFPQAVALSHEIRLRFSGVPGAVLVYTGHNDDGAPRALTLKERLEELFVFRSWLLTDLLFYAENYAPSLRPVLGVWSLRWYELNMRRIVAMSLDAGLVPIVSTVVGNRAGMGPALGVDSKLTGKEACAILREGWALEAEGRYAEAMRFYADQVGFVSRLRPFLDFRLGRCESRLGRYRKAERLFRETRNLEYGDNYHCATSRQNDYLRALARIEHVPLVDAAAIFREHSPHGLIGNNLFSDGHHPNAAGYALLANAYSETLANRFPGTSYRPFKSARDLFRRLGFSREARAAALRDAGRWLLSVSAGHYAPSERVELARRRFSLALSLDPNSCSGWIGLGLATAAQGCGFMADPSNLDFLERLHLGYSGYHPSKTEMPEILKKLRDAGVPGEMTGKIETVCGRRDDASI